MTNSSAQISFLCLDFCSIVFCGDAASGGDGMMVVMVGEVMMMVMVMVTVVINMAAIGK